ncbi:MAG TPA: hypothetical protein VGO86_17730 [Candidatus Dormibacteraeota bacterium]
MRVLLHRGQALLLVVAGLSGAVAVFAAFERDGLSTPVATGAANLVAPRRSDLPARIVIASSPAGSPAPAVSATSGAYPTPVAANPKPSPSFAVVPPLVYTYPPESHGGGHGGGD